MLERAFEGESGSGWLALSSVVSDPVRRRDQASFVARVWLEESQVLTRMLRGMHVRWPGGGK